MKKQGSCLDVLTTRKGNSIKRVYCFNADMKTYIIDYVVGNTYKTKRVQADSVAGAIKKARVKNIVDINIEEYIVKDEYAIRDF